MDFLEELRLHAQRNEEHIKFREELVPFGP
jgi:hypothetical protein